MTVVQLLVNSLTYAQFAYLIWISVNIYICCILVKSLTMPARTTKLLIIYHNG